MEKGQIVYFYYDSIIPCQKARIKEAIQGGYEVNWLNDDNKSTGTSSVPSNRVFATKEECIAYYNSLRNDVKDELRKQLLTKEDVLKYMYNAIYSEDYDWSAEKEVLKEKIEEIFGININNK